MNEAPASGQPVIAEDDVDAGDGNDVEDDDATAEAGDEETPRNSRAVTTAPAAPQDEPPTAAPSEQLTNRPADTAPEAATPTGPTPPRDEPVPHDPIDRADPGPVDR
jgi:hypothetical protein